MEKVTTTLKQFVRDWSDEVCVIVCNFIIYVTIIIYLCFTSYPDLTKKIVDSFGQGDLERDKLCGTWRTIPVCPVHHINYLASDPLSQNCLKKLFFKNSI